MASVRRDCIAKLSVDGIAAYQLTPNVELFALASTLFNASLPISESTIVEWRWERLRVNFWHQRMLSEVSDYLQRVIYQDLEFLDSHILAERRESRSKHVRVRFLLERAAIHTFHGFDVKARSDLETASRLRGFEYRLTGRLGKRTKFQEKDLSQLVVLAKSVDEEDTDTVAETNRATTNGSEASQTKASKPENLDLNDDTLLESINFSRPEDGGAKQQEHSLPESLQAIDPSNQPILKPFDSIILLSFASSITNTSPESGLTREETLPYATRVLDGGSSNWQIYTQALLVRSRIEGYRSRTVERGVLQLQALVDQVIADTTSNQPRSKENDDTNGASEATPSTFLPRPKPSESAPASERLRYIHELAPPTRWTLEAELAARWVSLGGLRTALEIYERLHMWAEAALCWAAVEREDKARKLVRRQLFTKTSATANSAKLQNGPKVNEDAEEYLGPELSPLPADAPRLFCILGDLEKEPTHYERAWHISNNRYARAQRSLGKHYLSTKQLPLADAAYSLSLKINPQNQSTWFALGCIHLELRNWRGAVQAFSRSVQLEEGDAEAWSNLAAALLRLPASESIATPEKNTSKPSAGILPDDEDTPSNEFTAKDPQRHVRSAFTAFKRAAKLKRNAHRIWQNVLNVGVTLSPPPYADIIQAQQRLIELRGAAEGESCVDVEAMEGLLAHVIAVTPQRNSAAPDHANIVDGSNDAELRERRKFGLEHMFASLLTQHVIPLITFSRRLWLLAARFAMHQDRPSSALDAYEKALFFILIMRGWFC